jgi:hypothetical protein
MLRSWQGKPALTTKPLLEDAETKRVDLAEADRLPSDSPRCERESADAAE